MATKFTNLIYLSGFGIPVTNYVSWPIEGDCSIRVFCQ